MARPLVTIPIAAYKSSPDHLSAAIDGALSQSWRDIEVVVSDDSPDARLEAVVRRFGDSRLSYRHNTPRLGVAANYWKCLREARGEFIAILNHDDVFAPSFLESLVPPLIDDPTLTVAFCDHWVISEHGERLLAESDHHSRQWRRSDCPPGKTAPFNQLLSDLTIPMAMGAAFRTNCLPVDLPETVGPAYDLWLVYVLCREGRGAYYVPERLSNWRIHPSSLTSQAGLDWQQGSAECWLTISQDFRLASIRNAARSNAAQAFFACAKTSWLQHQRLRCLSFGLKSLGALPTWKGLAACFLPLVPPSLIGRRQKASI